MTSGRFTAILAAAQMAGEHPLLGVGPGCYGFNYYPYKLTVEAAHPKQLDSGTRSLNFGEAHNDHLQVAAVAGVPGLALMLGCIILLAGRGRALQSAIDVRSRFARTLAPMLAAAFFIVAMGQFPLELAAPLITFIYLASLCMRWSAA